MGADSVAAGAVVSTGSAGVALALPFKRSAATKGVFVRVGVGVSLGVGVIEGVGVSEGIGVWVRVRVAVDIATAVRVVCAVEVPAARAVTVATVSLLAQPEIPRAPAINRIVKSVMRLDIQSSSCIKGVDTAFDFIMGKSESHPFLIRAV